MTTIKTDHQLIQKITPRNILSFGPDTPPIELGKLNVLIGSNGSGKSNLIDIIRLLRSCPRDIRYRIIRGGGVTEWIWKGEPKAKASIEVIVSKIGSEKDYRDINLTQEIVSGLYAKGTGNIPLRHLLSFVSKNQSFHLSDELIEDEPSDEPGGEFDIFYRNMDGQAIAQVRWRQNEAPVQLEEPEQSILRQLRDPRSYPEISYLASSYDKIAIYSDWTFGRNSLVREPQRTDMPSDILTDDFSNLGLFLNKLRKNPRSKKELLEKLRNLYEGVTDYDVSIEGSTVQVFFTEGDFIIPATRLSDGTLRYLCLLAILCDPTPPPLICIEEPEIGLHPDILPSLTDLMIEASQRTQLIVTTHSDIIIDALTEHPDTVLVAEKHQGQTEIRSLDLADLKVWLEKYRLGELWTRGDIGGESLVSDRIFVEGGGKSKTAVIRCREGFSKLLKETGLGNRFRILPCGSRNNAFQDFETEFKKSPTSYVGLIVDSEDPIDNIERTWDHLKIRDGWERPSGATDEQVMLMTTCMETWIIADHKALKDHFNAKDGKPISLKGVPVSNLESKPRLEVLKALEHATRDCSNKYKKGDESFDLLGNLDPNVLSGALPSFERMVRILKESLNA